MCKTHYDDDDWYQNELKPHEVVVRNWIRSRYSNGLDVEDLMQEAVVRVLYAKNRSSIKSPKAFFFATARNLAVEKLRKKRILTSVDTMSIDELEILDESESVEETVSRNHELEILTRAIQKLPARCRQVFTLCKVYGMSYEEVSREMGISVHTISSQITIGLAKCTEYMARYGSDRSSGGK